MDLQDTQLADLLHHEQERQRTGISLIASENTAYKEVDALMGSVLANKYAEGYPDKRYYAGCGWVDQIETLAIERCKNLFNAQHANVQPHAGSLANMAVYMAVLKPGDTILGMSLSSGGHLTHGQPMSFSGILYNSVFYTVDPDTELLDYTLIEELAHTHKPKLIIAGSSSYSRFIDFEKMKDIARSVSAYLLADCAHTIGLIAAGLHPSPFPQADFVTATTHKTLRGPRGGFILCSAAYKQQIDRAVFPVLQGGPFMHAIAAKALAFKKAQESEFKTYQQAAVQYATLMVDAFKERGYRVVSNGTDMHLFVIDLRNKNITGFEAEKRLEQADIFVSRSLVPFDPQKPSITSGIRLGTLSMTSRGVTEKEVLSLVERIDAVLTEKI